MASLGEGLEREGSGLRAERTTRYKGRAELGSEAALPLLKISALPQPQRSWDDIHLAARSCGRQRVGWPGHGRLGVAGGGGSLQSTPLTHTPS